MVEEKEEGRIGEDEGKIEWKLSEVTNMTVSRGQNELIRQKELTDIFIYHIVFKTIFFFLLCPNLVYSLLYSLLRSMLVNQ